MSITLQKSNVSFPSSISVQAKVACLFSPTSKAQLEKIYRKYYIENIIYLRVRVIVLKATFKNISVISWQSVFLVV